MWLHFPAISRLLPESEESILDYEWSSPEPVLWPIVNGTPSQRPCSWREWKKRHWIRLLFGTISRPSLAETFLDAWISLWVESPVNPGRLLAGEREFLTLEISGQTSFASSLSLERRWHSWKMFLGCSKVAYPGYSGNSISSGGMLSGECSVAAAWEPRTCESASSSWPTPDAANKSHGRPAGTSPTGITPDGRKVQIGLREVASHWPTPVAGNSGSNQGGGQGRVGMVRPSLTTLAGRWPTPKAQDWKRAAGGHDPDLQSVTGNWQTPRASAGSSGADTQRDGSRTPNLQQQTRDWPTPTSNNKTRPGGGTQASLDNLGSTWPTPTGTRHSATETGSLESLASGHQAETQSSGATSPSRSGQARRLNPAFVEWMMGFPPGWSLPIPTDPTAFAHWETLLAHQLPQWLGVCSREECWRP